VGLDPLEPAGASCCLGCVMIRRADLPRTVRIAVKLGTNVGADDGVEPALRRLYGIVEDCAQLWRPGYDTEECDRRASLCRRAFLWSREPEVAGSRSIAIG